MVRWIDDLKSALWSPVPSRWRPSHLFRCCCRRCPGVQCPAKRMRGPPSSPRMATAPMGPTASNSLRKSNELLTGLLQVRVRLGELSSSSVPTQFTDFARNHLSSSNF
jgi:hypothetical protein